MIKALHIDSQSFAPTGHRLRQAHQSGYQQVEGLGVALGGALTGGCYKSSLMRLVQIWGILEYVMIYNDISYFNRFCNHKNGDHS